MVTRAALSLVLVGSLAACGQRIDPCPRGYRASRTQDRCIAALSADAAEATTPDSADAEIAPPEGVEPRDDEMRDDDGDAAQDVDSGPVGADAGASMLADAEGTDAGGDSDVVDADLDADAAGDASSQMDALTGDAEPLDATVDAGFDAMDSGWDSGPDGSDSDTDTGPEADASTDASPDATPEPDSSTLACPTADSDLWRAMHLAEGMRNVITDCGVNCDGGVECTDQCLRQAAGVQSCHECTRAQAECGARWCGYACLPSRTDRICLACLCQADCVDAFGTCAGRDLALCDPGLFVANPAPNTPALDTPAVLLGKSLSGVLASVRFDANTGLLTKPDITIDHFPSGATQLVTITLAQREVVFRYGASCAEPPCTVRGYPMLADGTFGAPVFEERWDAEFVDFETFSLGGMSYLARLRESSDAQVSENLLIDRLEWNAEQATLTRSSTLRTRLVSSTQHAFVQLEAFAIGADVFLLLSAPKSGAARILRVQGTAIGLELLDASESLQWSLGWDHIEAFKSFDRWYLFTYKSGRAQISDEPAGQVRIWLPTLDSQGKVALGNPVLEGQLAEGLTHTLSFTDDTGRAHVLLHDYKAGSLKLHSLDADPSHWADNLSQPVQEQQRGKASPWDIFSVARQGKW